VDVNVVVDADVVAVVCLDAPERIAVFDSADPEQSRAPLERIVSMLTVLIRP
jgi:hypothetical protein